MRRKVAPLALALALSTTGATTALAQHEGHNHGEPEGPAMGLEDLSVRASTAGEHFQFVALPKDGRLVSFLDDTVCNAPPAGARLELLAGDALVTAEEAARKSTGLNCSHECDQHMQSS